MFEKHHTICMYDNNGLCAHVYSLLGLCLIAERYAVPLERSLAGCWGIYYSNFLNFNSLPIFLLS